MKVEGIWKVWSKDESYYYIGIERLYFFLYLYTFILYYSWSNKNLLKVLNIVLKLSIHLFTKHKLSNQLFNLIVNYINAFPCRRRVLKIFRHIQNIWKCLQKFVEELPAEWEKLPIDKICNRFQHKIYYWWIGDKIRGDMNDKQLIIVFFVIDLVRTV